MGVSFINPLLAALTLVGAVLVPISFTPPARSYLSKHGLVLAFLFALGAVLGSFYYSNVVGYAPCVLCWYQRIFLVPQILMLGIAAWKKDICIRIYSIALSVMGAFVAVYNIFVEHNLAPSPCGVTGPSCAIRYVYEFGFISMAVMSLVIFSLIIVCLLPVRSSE